MVNERDILTAARRCLWLGGLRLCAPLRGFVVVEMQIGLARAVGAEQAPTMGLGLEAGREAHTRAGRTGAGSR